MIVTSDTPSTDVPLLFPLYTYLLQCASVLGRMFEGFAAATGNRLFLSIYCTVSAVELMIKLTTKKNKLLKMNAIKITI